MNELDIFSAAVEIDDSCERARFIDDACGNDDKLRRRLAELLESANKHDSFLESPPQVPVPSELSETLSAPNTEQLGQQIGPFKLLQKLGEGGMGTVFMAEQKYPVRRRVALKIVKLGMDSKAIIRRFEAERQALSMMDHPNIARALDAGTTDNGRPYFVMELVKGVPITRYCDDHKLTVRERLELLVPICHAVQHAHQKGIVHRDIKPSNILIAEYDEKAVPKVIDFGVAKAMHQPLTEKTLFTQVGQIVGTLEYMSPEQAKVNELDVDTRSDVYSLGVVMYELLTGSTPHEKKRLRSVAMDELIRIIRDEEPPRPSKRLSSNETLPTVATSRKTDPARLGAIVRGELDWIVMKALDKERNRRYQTCGELADDIRRYLNDEQVLACPPTPEYRLRKFVRRNAGAVAAISAVIVALLLGLVATGWQWKKVESAYRELAARNARLRSYQANSNQSIARHKALFDRGQYLDRKLVRTFDEMINVIDRHPGWRQSDRSSSRRQLLTVVRNYWDEAVDSSKQANGDDGPNTDDYRIQRAVVVARLGDHAQAFKTVVAIGATNNSPEYHPTRERSADLARICSLCAAAASENQTLASNYVDHGFGFLRSVLIDAKSEIDRIDREAKNGIQTAEKEPLVSATVAFLEDPALEALRSRKNDFADARGLFPFSSAPSGQHETQNPSNTLSVGSPYQTGVALQ